MGNLGLFCRLNLCKKNDKKEKNRIYYGSILFLVTMLFFIQQGIVRYSSIVAYAEELSGQKIVRNKNNSNSNNEEYKKIIESFREKEYPLKTNIVRKEKNVVVSEIDAYLDDMTVGYPINEMIPFILRYDKNVIGLIIGIAKKESNWGKRSPVKNSKICYNYWGYKGRGFRGTSLGYACFLSPEEAVATIGDRIQRLVKQGLETPAKMIVWKCGRTCAGHNPSGVKKWISDVGVYYNKIIIK